MTFADENLLLGHVTRGYEPIGFTEILRAHELKAMRCKHMQEDIAYLHVGGLYYRYKDEIKEPGDIVMLPVGLLFGLTVHDDVKRYAPTDTGALRLGLLGEERSSDKRSRTLSPRRHRDGTQDGRRSLR